MNPDSYRDQTPMLVRVFNRKVRDFFCHKGARSQSFSLSLSSKGGTVCIVNLSEVEDHARSSAIKIVNLCRVTCVVFDFAQTDKL